MKSRIEIHYNTISHWDKIRNFSGGNHSDYERISELEFEGSILQKDEDIAHGLKSYFSTIGTKLNSTAKSDVDTNHSPNINDNNSSQVSYKFLFELSEVSNSEVSKTL